MKKTCLQTYKWRKGTLKPSQSEKINLNICKIQKKENFEAENLIEPIMEREKN